MDDGSPQRPAPTGILGKLRNIGPGVVVSGSVVGSGELLVTTRMGAEVGFVFLWGVIFASVIKYFIQLELGRQCLLNDETTVASLNRIPGFRIRGVSWLAWLCVIGYASVFISLIGILGSVGGLLSSVFSNVPYQVWCIIVFVLVAALLWRGIYEELEKMVTILVAFFSLVVIGSLIFLQDTSYAFSTLDLMSGFSFEMPTQGAFVALALMGSVGATAVELFMYPYWLREKGYPGFIGPNDGTPEWKERYRGWMRVLATDAGVCTAIALIITCAYYILGASVLSRLEVIPSGVGVVDQVSLIFTETLGPAAKGIFMLGAFCTLFSTLLVFAASSGRIGADFLHMIGVDFAKKEEDCKKLSRTLQTAFPAFWLLVILIWSQTPFFFVLLGQNSNSILLLPIAYGVLYLAMRETKDRRMSPLVGLALVVTVLAITIFTFVNLYHSWTS
tara:strand:- start:80 stop:1417 length:1338 start_codon:yes stop_codon:yes gene_type:complete